MFVFFLKCLRALTQVCLNAITTGYFQNLYFFKEKIHTWLQSVSLSFQLSGKASHLIENKDGRHCNENNLTPSCGTASRALWHLIGSQVKNMVETTAQWAKFDSTAQHKRTF